jgi:hypothetical protein
MRGMNTEAEFANATKVPALTSDEIREARLRMVAAGLRQKASHEDIKTVLEAMGDPPLDHIRASTYSTYGKPKGLS